MQEEHAGEIDEILRRMNHNGLAAESIFHEGIPHFHKLLNWLAGYGFLNIDRSKITPIYSLTDKGQDVIKADGWIAYHKQEEQKEYLKAERAKAETERAAKADQQTDLAIKKLKDDIGKSGEQTELIRKQIIAVDQQIEDLKRKNRYFWVSFGMAIASFVMAVILLILRIATGR